MPDTVTRAEFEAFARTVTARLDAIAASVADLARDLDETKEATGCTTPEGLDADKRLRRFIVNWDSDTERRDRADHARMLDWFRRQEANRDEARQRLGDWAARLGLVVTVITVVGGVLSGASAGVIWLMRWVTGGAP